MSNLLKDKFPDLLKEWNYEENTINLETITYGSNKKVNWKCKKGHKWSASVKHRAVSKSGCPYCSGRKPTPESNLKVEYPEIAKQWDYEKNELKPEEVNSGTVKKYFWICEKGHSYKTSPNRKTSSNVGCLLCSNLYVLKEDSVGHHYPNLYKQWDDKNIDPYKTSLKSNKKVNFQCKQNHKFSLTLSQAKKFKIICPYCGKRKASKIYNLKTKYPHIAKEWDYQKNVDKPEIYLPSSSQRKFWICEKSHSWELPINLRTRLNRNCPICSRNKVSKEYNFKTEYPKLAKQWDYEKNELKPEQISPGSNNKFWFKCNKNHKFLISPNRYKNIKNCQYCSKQLPSKEYNFKTEYPKLAKQWDYEKNELKPEEVLPRSSKVIYFKCKNLHSYKYSLASMTALKRSEPCQYCSKQLPSKEYNFKTEYPKLAKQWDYEKNELKPEEVLPHNKSKIFFLCNQKKHSFMSTPSKLSSLNSSGCPICSGKIVIKSTSLGHNYPKLVAEYSKSNEINVFNISPYSSKKVEWVCSSGHSWMSRVADRTKKSSLCPYCSKKLASKSYNLKATKSPILKFWDYEKNIIDPENFTPGSSKIVNLKCKSGHSWKNTIKKANNSVDCPYCINRRISSSNNLAITFPQLLNEWDYKRNKINPKNILPGSAKKVWWICKTGHNWQAEVRNRSNFSNRYKTGCPYCTLTPRSREEVILLFELKQFFNIDVNDHKIKLKRVEDVDIKLANEKVVIEYDGAYWHKDKAERDKTKTKALEKAGWTVIRVREKPLKVLSRKYNVSSTTGEYKETANKVLKKLNQLGYEAKGLDKYLERKTLVNKKEAEKYIDKLLKEKNKK